MAVKWVLCAFNFTTFRLPFQYEYAITLWFKRNANSVIFTEKKHLLTMGHKFL